MSEELHLDLNGYEGPIDLLLSLARDKKIDLAVISVSALADQYLAFIASARGARLEVAAEYLVMAAWLAYLKSRLLLPREQTHDGAPSAEQMAEALAEQIAPAGDDADSRTRPDGLAAPGAGVVAPRHAGGPAGTA